MRPFAHALRSLTRCPSGSVAVEFALALPLLVVLLTGLLAVSQMIAVNGKVETAASSMADLITRLKTVAVADRSDVVMAGQQILYPSPADAGSFGGRITCVSFTQTSKGYQPSVVWQHSFGTTPGTAPNLTPLAALAQPGVSVILVNLTYLYRPIITGGILDNVTFEKSAVARMRLTSSC